MATASKTPGAMAAAVLLLLITAVAIAPASASSLMIYQTRGCRQPFCGRCGVWYNMGPRYYKGYFFKYEEFNCRGANIPFRRDARCCIRMLCLQ